MFYELSKLDFVQSGVFHISRGVIKSNSGVYALKLSSFLTVQTIHTR